MIYDNNETMTSFLESGVYCYDRGDTEESITLLKKAVEEKQEGRDEHIALARAYLRINNFELGLKHFDWIWNTQFPNQIGIFSGNQSLVGLKLLLSADAALGDTIQLSRFSKLLMDRGAFVSLEVQPDLVKLMSNSNIANEVVSSGQLPSHFNLRIPLHNLMGSFNITFETIPCFDSYLKCDDKNTNIDKKTFTSSDNFRVGVCWCGHPDRPFDVRRSIPYDAFSRILNTDNVDFFALQLNNIPASFPGINLNHLLKDCNDTAVLISQMDLVITVDSMVAHLASALGIPVILLNRLGGCWRWVDGKTYSTWYPKMLIVTQKTYDDWESVIEHARQILVESRNKGKAAWL